MIGTPLSDRARRVRHVDVDSQLVITIDEDKGDYFPARVLPAPFLTSPSDASPRDTSPRKRLVWDVEQELNASDRVEVYRDTTYELVSRVRPLRSGGHEVGFEAELMEPDVLYPAEGELQEQGGEPVDGFDAVRLSIFAPFDQVRERGDYDLYSGQAPIEYEVALTRKNRVLDVGGRIFRIVSATPGFDVPYLVLTLRRSGERETGS